MHNGKLTWVDIHSIDGDLPYNLTKEALLSDIHAISEERVLVGAEAISLIISTIPGAKRFSWLMEKDSAKKAINIFHETSDRLRRKLINSCPSCKNRHL